MEGRAWSWEEAVLHQKPHSFLLPGRIGGVNAGDFQAASPTFPTALWGLGLRAVQSCTEVSW